MTRPAILRATATKLRRGIHGLALACLVVGCAAPHSPPPSPPRSYLVLLQNDDGTTGRVVYTGSSGPIELNQNGQAVGLVAPGATFMLDAPQLHRDADAAIKAQPLAPKTFLLYFETGEAQINRASEALLGQIFSEVKSRPAPDISVIGHTDTAGTDAYNEALAQRRAEKVGLLLKGAAKDLVNLEITSHGERNLLVPTADGVEEPRNRRVEVTVR